MEKSANPESDDAPIQKTIVETNAPDMMTAIKADDAAKKIQSAFRTRQKKKDDSEEKEPEETTSQ